MVAGWIGAHLARGKVKSVEHGLSWSLYSKQLPLPFTFINHCCTFSSSLHERVKRVHCDLIWWGHYGPVHDAHTWILCASVLSRPIYGELGCKHFESILEFDKYTSPCQLCDNMSFPKCIVGYKWSQEGCVCMTAFYVGRWNALA